MTTIALDFEKPLEELEKKIADLEQIEARAREEGRERNPEVVQELRTLRRRLVKERKEIYSKLSPWQRVQLARHPNRPYTLDYISRIFTNFMEFHGDRRYSDDPAIVGGFAQFNGKPVMVIGTQKGRNTKENVFRNFGCPHPEGYRKANRLMKLANLARVPIITFIDTPGAYPGIAAEERHIGEAIAVNLRDMFALEVPVICIVIGEGGSGGALAIGVGNRVFLLENSYYSVITPEGCAAILWKDRTYAPKAAAALKLTADELVKLNLIDGVIPEPLGGAHLDYDKAARFLKTFLAKQLAELSKESPTALKAQRYDRFRDIAFYRDVKN